MDFQLMEATIHELLKDIIDHFSIYIQTSDGDISINAFEPKRAASTIKLPILIEAFRQIEAGNLQPDTLVYIETDMKTGGAGVIDYLTNSNVYSYRNLLELMIIVSDNTAANIILDKIGMDTVNELAAAIGCNHTILSRKFMQLKDPSLENYTSAQDMVKFLHLMEETDDLLSETSRNEIKQIMGHQQNNCKIAHYMNHDECIKVYHKTGELTGIEHDVALLTYQEQKVYLALLSENWQNNGTGRDYLAAIGKIVLQYLRNYGK
ncbi:hypothetical protein CFK37_07285 [Virgibacillus phasianinus]|uniref:Beta-lactamase class A catalytic domain-containing protein n=1 Tax=Virgibacillus phasianinus TaxID=2017483 RepID=A0A220U1Q5_9BACI|nr:serine hydrolase [Virgibacillus phasianinus]ASK61975.1 hypothetical protein CFK37_07285 [Virgibacillus phasianinus]